MECYSLSNVHGNELLISFVWGQCLCESLSWQFGRVPTQVTFGIRTGTGLVRAICSELTHHNLLLLSKLFVLGVVLFLV